MQPKNYGGGLCLLLSKDCTIPWDLVSLTMNRYEDGVNASTSGDLEPYAFRFNKPCFDDVTALIKFVKPRAVYGVSRTKQMSSLA